MKILAIRGCNLASLAGEFEIDLAKGPLGAAGVFAIVGPTGAGKSTLLDAMCIALFDRTPRLANRSTVVVGRGDDDPTALGAQDVRSILRRGASSGWAEVDFESGDARRYRARWSVRRARNATDGRFQSQQVTLTTLDGGEALGGTKTETLEAIHARLGLSFDQFRRSALLAQGEFAAFLRADGKDRSELLERMTGTEIYSRLSIAAHQRAALAEQQLRERHGAALAIPILADDERAKAHADLAFAKDAQVAARARLAAAQTASRWLAEDARRTRALADADAARSAAEASVHLAAGERAELALRRRAETLRTPWDSAARLERQLALAQRDAALAADAATHADAALRDVDAHRTRLAELHAPIRDARISAGLVERELAVAAHASADGTRRRARTTSRAPQTTRDVAGDSLDRDLAADGHAALERLERRAVGAAASAGWLVARLELGPLVATWRDLDGTLGQQASLGAELATFDEQLAERGRSREQLVARRTAAAGAHQAALARLAEAQAEAAGFEKRRGLTLDAARRAEDEARRRCADVERLVAIAAEARAILATRAEVDQRAGELSALATADAELRRTTEAERDAATTLRNERTRMLEELRKAAGYEHDRAELVDGEPCPLCGADEHPWASRGTLDALIVDAQARLAEATQRTDAARETLAAISARDAHRTKERARLEGQGASADRALAAATTRWREHLAVLGELLLVDDAASDAARDLAAERAASTQAKLEAARAARSQAEAVAKAAADAQSRVQARQADVEHAAHGVREIDASVAVLDAAAERQRGEQAAKQERHAQLVATIVAAFSRWYAALAPHDAARPMLELALSEMVSDTISRGRAHVAAETVSDAVFRVPHAVALLERCRRGLADVAAAWSGHADLVVDVDAQLGAALSAIDDRSREAERLLADAVARRDAAAASVTRATAELAEASARLEDARIGAGFAVDELRRLLADAPSRVEQLAQRLEALDRALDRARTLAAERRRHVDDHGAASPFLALAQDQEAEHRLRLDAARVDELDAAVAEADRHVATLIAALAADDDARGRRAEALARHAAAEQAAEVDRVLGEVIGSHDGKLFRSFAQSLTLDGLLAVANSHLDELAPRYQLERVPKHDLELQVIDRDLGNEIRSVQSLSGGESFLVSLALALGLSSMSAHDVRVRTLLIDEGFGTLDPTTLDAALAVLDALQATGRQVGVISHVPALVERVGAHVRVLPRGGGKSDVIVADA